MARDILSEYGPESMPDAEPGFVDGGVLHARGVMNYQEPYGPKNRHNPHPGLPGGTNVGQGPNMGANGDGGEATTMYGDQNLGCCGTQGTR